MTKYPGEQRMSSTVVSPAATMLYLLLVFCSPAPVSLSDDAQHCPHTLYDCATLETSLINVADVILTPDFVSVNEEHADVNEICRFLQTPSCSDSVLSECKGEVVYASGAVKARIQYVCGEKDPRKESQELKKCLTKFRRNISNCAKKSRKQREQLEWSGPAVAASTSWCNLTQEYITCVYSVMALGCAFDVANHYMQTVNMSAPVVQAIRGYGCTFGHPLDLLRTTSPVSVVTSAPVRGPDPSQDRPALRAASSGVWRLAAMPQPALALLVSPLFFRHWSGTVLVLDSWIVTFCCMAIWVIQHFAAYLQPG